MVRKRVIYEGRVQGVGFRYTCKDIARGFEVIGTVRNLEDGTVELLACGDDVEVDAFLREIAEDSPVAHHIRAIHVEDAPFFSGTGFQLIRS